MAATKQDLIDEANKRGIALTGDETVPELKEKLDADDVSNTDQVTSANVTDSGIKSHAQEEREAVATAGHVDKIHDEAKEMDAKENRAGASAPASPSERAKAEEAGEVTIKYRDHEGKEVERTYSREVHGDNFFELAEEFKKANANRLV